MIQKLEKNCEFNNVSSPTAAAIIAPQQLQNECLNNNEYHSSSEFSLLERYLNSEQAVANKHAQIESLLGDWFRLSCSAKTNDGGSGGGEHETSLSFDDYSIIDYILNQEGISMRTFGQLIREKFDYIEWPREILVELYRIVNGDLQTPPPLTESEDEKTITRPHEFQPVRNGNYAAIFQAWYFHQIIIWFQEIYS